MKIFWFLAAIAWCSPVAVAAPAELSRKKRVSGYEDAGIDKELEDDYGDYNYEDYKDYEENTFACTSGDEKVPLYLMCDGYIDCTDATDEVAANCLDNGISPSAFMPDVFTSSSTSNLKTTLAPVEPDVRKIGDYEDYADACTEDEFQCPSDIYICLPISQVCDGINDCPEKEDEAKCTGTGNWLFSQFGLPHSRFDEHVVESELLKKPKENYYRDYSPVNENQIPETTSKTEGVVRPKIIFKEPPRPNSDKSPKFVSHEKGEDDEHLGLEAEFRYLSQNEDGNIQNDPLDVDTAVQNSNPNDTTINSPRLSPDHQIEINHETGEVTLIENGMRRLLPPLMSDQDWLLQPHGVEGPKPTTRLPERSHGFGSSGKKIVNRKKELRGIVGQLLHHIGSMMEEEERESEDFGNLNVQVGLGNKFPETSLYSRIQCRPRTHVTLNFDIRL